LTNLQPSRHSIDVPGSYFLGLGGSGNEVDCVAGESQRQYVEVLREVVPSSDPKPADPKPVIDPPICPR
jgi:hypothetical protein